ncbi:MAG: thioredoxin family protein [Bacteroidales bacterium]
MQIKKRVTLLILSLFLGFSAQVMAQGINFDTKSTWQQLLETAKNNNKLIFLDCYTDWCGPCKGMADRVFTNPEVGKYMNSHFICTKRDMEKGEGIELSKTYKKYIPGFPTYLLINYKGEVVHQAAGYMEAEKFINSMKEGMENKTWIAYKERYEKGERDWDFLSEYFILLEDAVQQESIKEAKVYALENLTIEALKESGSAYRIFKQYWTDVTSPLFKEFMGNGAIYRKYGEREREIGDWAGRLYDRKIREIESQFTDEKSTLSSLRDSQLPSDIEDLKQELIKGFTYGREEKIARLLLFNSLLDKDFDRYVALVENGTEFGMFRYYKDNISTFCRLFFNDVKGKKDIAKCLELTEVDPDGKMISPRQIRNWAYFLDLSGEKKRAADLVEKAAVLEAEIKKNFEKFFK